MAIGALAFLSACSGGSGNNAAGRNAAAAPRPPTYDWAAFADCPPDNLMCGRRRPVISDGVTLFANEGMYLSMVFPAGSQVCMAHSGQEPRGFFAVYGGAPGCLDEQLRPDRGIKLFAMPNDLYRETAEETQISDCTPPAPDLQRRLANAPLAVRGFGAMICERRMYPGMIDIELTFLGGPWWDSPAGVRRRAVYIITLNTTDAHLDEDLARFRQVLASVRIATRD
jgi:hypothetical protein